ncbi:uncharacterized protein LOC119735476 isoform X2 [Patiria miniata]|uniref:Uncharacterized protein n=1 Tax=Patiria miniata TaxID=46514 RepID=A0A914AMY5_PATMI|nr:uncharacterized protein LOC119735476 isoform X2 [Patiria miniata]
MPIQRHRSGSQQMTYDVEDEYSDEWEDSFQDTDVICITPPVGYKPKARDGHQQVYLSKMILQRMKRASGASETRRAREVFRRYEERRHLARQMLKQSPEEPSSPPLPGSVIGSRLQDDVEYYSSDFTEDEDDAKWVGDAGRHIVTIETSSGGEEVLTSSEDEEIQLLMGKSDKHTRRRTSSVVDFGKQCRGDRSHKGKNASSSATNNAAKDNLPDTDGRRFNLPHDRPLDPWRLPPIENLTKKGPVNLVLNPATSQDTAWEGPSTASIPDQMLMKSLRAKARKLKKHERQKRKRKQMSEKK